MEPNQDQINNSEKESNEEIEEIYICKKCNYPLSSTLSIREARNNYDDIIDTVNTDLDPKKYKCIFILTAEKIEKDFNMKRLCFQVDLKKKKIICKNDSENVGFIRKTNVDKLGIELIFGYLRLKDIIVNQVGFKFKKEIPVHSQEQYTVLAKLKQLRYYVKQIAPTLKMSMDLIKEERNNIFNCEDNFEKYKLNLVLNKYKDIQKQQNKDENQLKKDK